MTRHPTNPLPHLVESFFCAHLQRARGASAHTVRAYRDTLRLLFIHLADAKGCSVANLQLRDLHVDAVADFLTHLEAERRNTAATRNCRLAAIRSFLGTSYVRTPSTRSNTIASYHCRPRRADCRWPSIWNQKMCK